MRRAGGSRSRTSSWSTGTAPPVFEKIAAIDLPDTPEATKVVVTYRFSERSASDKSSAGAKRSGPRVELEGFKFAGLLAETDIADTIRMHRDELDDCYREARRDDSAKEGSLTYVFVVTPGGSVASVERKDGELDSENLETCLKGRMKGWVFPSGRIPTHVILPMKFRAD